MSELAPIFTMPPTVKRGRWVHHEVITWSGVITGAWQLDGLDWWLRKRTGATQSTRWCGYCWREPYRWWHLHLCPPREWLVLSPPNRYAQYSLEGLNQNERRLFPYPAGWEPGHGYCTHKRLLSSAMKSAEKALDERILKVLAGN